MSGVQTVPSKSKATTLGRRDIAEEGWFCVGRAKRRERRAGETIVKLSGVRGRGQWVRKKTRQGGKRNEVEGGEGERDELLLLAVWWRSRCVGFSFK